MHSRVRDGKMLANYRLSAELTAIETTADGRCIVVGTVDGCLSVLAIADPLSPDPYQFLASLPSRSMQASCDKTFRPTKRKGNCNVDFSHLKSKSVQNRKLFFFFRNLRRNLYFLTEACLLNRFVQAQLTLRSSRWRPWRLLLPEPSRPVGPASYPKVQEVLLIVKTNRSLVLYHKLLFQISLHLNNQ